MRGRQDSDAVERAGVRLKLLKAQALVGDIVLLFADESEALTHPYLARAYLTRAWAKRGADLRVEAPGQSHKVAMIGALDQRSHWLTPEWLPKYAPELNDIERSWKTLKSQRLAHQTFKSPDHLEKTINTQITDMNTNRKNHPLANLRISA